MVGHRGLRTRPQGGSRGRRPLSHHDSHAFQPQCGQGVRGCNSCPCRTKCQLAGRHSRTRARCPLEGPAGNARSLRCPLGCRGERSRAQGPGWCPSEMRAGGGATGHQIHRHSRSQPGVGADRGGRGGRAGWGRRGPREAISIKVVGKEDWRGRVAHRHWGREVHSRKGFRHICSVDRE